MKKAINEILVSLVIGGCLVLLFAIGLWLECARYTCFW